MCGGGDSRVGGTLEVRGLFRREAKRGTATAMIGMSFHACVSCAYVGRCF